MMQKGLAIAVVLAWWFMQARLDLLFRWRLPRDTSQVLALVFSLVLGFLLYRRLRLGERVKAVPLLPLLAIGACALWLLAAPHLLGKPMAYEERTRAYLEWAMVLAVIGGSAWLVLRLPPSGEVTLGPHENAPTLRLALAVAAMLSISSMAWVMPSSTNDAVEAMSQWFSMRGQSGGRMRESALDVASRWFITALPFVAGAALVWGGRLGPRILARRPGLMRINVYLVLWIGAQLLALYIGSLVSAPATANPGRFVGVLVGVMLIAPFLPVLSVVLLWAVFHMLLTLGGPATTAVRTAPAPAPTPASDAAGAATRPSMSREAGEIKRLLGERRVDEALARYATGVQASPDFDPGTSAVVPLTKQALKADQAQLALKLLSGFGTRRPADTATPLFKWLHGQALLATGQQEDGLALLQRLMLAHPEDPLAREARHVLARHQRGT
ncbi:MAG: hypothetical protein Tsb007_05660 [Rhizobacter sp.]